jgi:hypothetical protein
LANRLGLRVQWDAENTGDLVRRVHPAAGASADSAAWAGRDADRWGGRQKVKDRGFRLATGLVAAESERRVGRKRQPQAGRSLADPAVVGQARRDVVRAQLQGYFVLLGVKAVHELPEAPASAVRRAVEPDEALPGQADVGPLGLQGEALRE